MRAVKGREGEVLRQVAPAVVSLQGLVFEGEREREREREREKATLNLTPALQFLPISGLLRD